MKVSLTLFVTIFILASTMVQGSEPSCLDCHLTYGKCINHQCICSDGWLGSDCRTYAIKLLPNKTFHQIIESSAWVYLYFPLDGIHENVLIYVEATSGSIKVSSLFQGRNSFEIPRLGSNKGLELENENQALFYVSNDDVLSTKSDKIVLGIYNSRLNESASVHVSLLYDNLDKSAVDSIGLIVVIVTSVLICCLASASCQRWRRRVLAEEEIHRIIQTEQGELMGNNPINQQKQKTFLTPQEIEEYFPKKKFLEFNKSLFQPSCSVCLEEFENESQCHQLYCEHIFHDDCIQSWLLKHDNCPDCRKEMTHEAIKENLNTIKKEKPVFLKLASGETQLDSLPQSPIEAIGDRYQQNNQFGEDAHNLIRHTQVLLQV